jgi:hypothetical protein
MQYLDRQPLLFDQLTELQGATGIAGNEYRCTACVKMFDLGFAQTY